MIKRNVYWMATELKVTLHLPKMQHPEQWSLSHSPTTVRLWLTRSLEEVGGPYRLMTTDTISKNEIMIKRNVYWMATELKITLHLPKMQHPEQWSLSHSPTTVRLWLTRSLEEVGGPYRLMTTDTISKNEIMIKRNVYWMATELKITLHLPKMQHPEQWSLSHSPTTVRLWLTRSLEEVGGPYRLMTTDTISKNEIMIKRNVYWMATELKITLHLPKMQHPEQWSLSHSPTTVRLWLTRSLEEVGGPYRLMTTDTISQFPLQPKDPMYLHQGLVVTFAAFLACVAIVSASTLDFDTKVENWDDVGIKRLLRTEIDATEDRAFTISGLVAKVKLSSDLRARLNAGESADDVGKFLMGETRVKRVLSDPNFNKLVEYVDKFNKKFPNRRVRTVDVLSSMYGEAAVAKMLVKHKDTNEWAARLLGNQVAGWIEHNTPVGVLRIFLVDDAVTSPLVAKNLKAWDNYMDVLANREPTKVISKFTAFRKAYKDEGLARLIDRSRTDLKAGPLAFEFKTSLFEKWRLGDVTMDNINTKIFKSGQIDRIAERIKSDYMVYLKTGKISLY